MAPDLNSLPPSASSSPPSPNMPRAMSITSQDSLRGHSPSPRTASTSLQAAAAVNAGLQQEDSRRSSISSVGRQRQSPQAERRRSIVLMNLQLNDPTLPAPGQMVNEPHPTLFRTASPQSVSGSPILPAREPQHIRNPSLGEIHQELEQEQEAQVNRLLQMIRIQQAQLQQLQAASGQGVSPSAIDDSTPLAESLSSTAVSTPQPGTSRSPSTQMHPRSSFDIARADIQRRSRTPSRHASPRLGTTSISGESSEAWSLAGRDESAFYQAETQMMIRENQMLRQRIRELERQLHANAAVTHEPTTPSHLASEQTSVDETPSPGVELPEPALAEKKNE